MKHDYGLHEGPAPLPDAYQRPPDALKVVESQNMYMAQPMTPIVTTTNPYIEKPVMNPYIEKPAMNPYIEKPVLYYGYYNQMY
jgi:hypothetical protein